VIDGDARAAFVLDRIADAAVHLSYKAPPGDPRGVRDFTLYFYGQLAPASPMPHYADGTPVGSARVIAPDVLRVIVEEFARAGFFDQCVRWHSEATPQPATPPPADSRAFDPTFWATTYPSGALTVRVAVSTRDWHHNFEQAYPLDRDVRDVLIRIVDRVPDDVRGDLEAGLLSNMR
jgi:hypothetical protein